MSKQFLNITNHQVKIDFSDYPTNTTFNIILPTGQHVILAGTIEDASLKPLSLTEFKRLRNEFLEYLAIESDIQPATIKSDRKHIREFTDWLQQHTYEPNNDAWRKYYAWRKSKYKANTVRNRFYSLKKFADWLTANHHISENPYENITPPKNTKNTQPKAIAREHIKMMLREAMQHPRDLALLIFMRDTGTRAMEPLNLKWHDIDFEARNVAILGKGNKARTVFLEKITIAALLHYRQSLSKERRASTAPVWWGDKGPLTYNGLYKIFVRLADKAGVKDEALYNPHAWRHAFGRDTTLAGMPTAVLQDLMGHASLDVTKIYSMFDTADLQMEHTKYSPLLQDAQASPAIFDMLLSSEYTK